MAKQITITLKLSELEIQALRTATLEYKKTMNKSYNFIVRPINEWTKKPNHNLTADELQSLNYFNKATQSLHRKVLTNTKITEKQCN
tara:strand:+ start:388 stop:648 length:261 start_codon:yes stop_codon:yes gene_type:complete